MVREQRRMAYAQVDRYLSMRPHLASLKDDLMQEAMLAVLEAEATFDPSKGYPRGLWLAYQANYAIMRYVAQKEQKHFRGTTVDPESQYWDLEEIPNVEEIPAEVNETQEDLMELLSGIKFTRNQQVVLACYLETGDHKKSREQLGVSKQRVNEIYGDCIRKIRKANELPLDPEDK